MPEILRRAGAAPPIDILKVDIEGAETAVFRGQREWLRFTRHLAIELHGPEPRAALDEALAPLQWRQHTSGELTIASNLQLSTV